jgi:hypothetical protein
VIGSRRRLHVGRDREGSGVSLLFIPQRQTDASSSGGKITSDWLIWASISTQKQGRRTMRSLELSTVPIRMPPPCFLRIHVNSKERQWMAYRWPLTEKGKASKAYISRSGFALSLNIDHGKVRITHCHFAASCHFLQYVPMVHQHWEFIWVMRNLSMNMTDSLYLRLTCLSGIQMVNPPPCAWFS